MDNVIMEMQNLSLKAGRRYLVKDINWQIKKGEHWAVFGLNGSGKTTLLSIMAGFKMPSAGMIKVFGEEYDNENLLRFRKKIGFVSGSYFDRYYHEESALEIVLAGSLGTLGLDFEIADSDVL